MSTQEQEGEDTFKGRGGNDPATKPTTVPPPRNRKEAVLSPLLG